MRVDDFDYDLPEHLIAQEPIEPRDHSRLMLLNRTSGSIHHAVFRDIIHYLHQGDVLVLNNTRVIPARLRAVKLDTSGQAEVLLLRQLSDVEWHVIVGGRRIVQNTMLGFPGSDITATVTQVLEASERVVRFSKPVNDLLQEIGEMPLPPYIHTHLQDKDRYQTVYSQHEGSAAAPTAGLHFTPELLLALRQKGVQFAYCTLHIGLGTFQPVKVDNIQEHKIHSEFAVLTAENASIINQAKLAGRRIIAVGTTSVRTLESAAIISAGGQPHAPLATTDLCPWRPVTAFEADTSLYIYPGYQWRVVDAIITNFHLPRSTLVMMISAFAGRENVLSAYAEAVRQQYRFFSFGDAMFIHT
jgi:S-adenosylmethionine:tRNA ribosyltransferase-isomerase